MTENIPSAHGGSDRRQQLEPSRGTGLPLEAQAPYPPRVLPTSSGRYLAVSDDRARFRIGVFGDTEAEAVANYVGRYCVWERLLGTLR